MNLLNVLSDGDGVSEGSAAQVAGEALPLVVRKVALHVQLVTVTLTESLPAKFASEKDKFSHLVYLYSESKITPSTAYRE